MVISLTLLFNWQSVATQSVIVDILALQLGPIQVFAYYLLVWLNHVDAGRLSRRVSSTCKSEDLAHRVQTVPIKLYSQKLSPQKTSVSYK